LTYAEKVTYRRSTSLTPDVAHQRIQQESTVMKALIIAVVVVVVLVDNGSAVTGAL
jgi:hypothetical protein